MSLGSIFVGLAIALITVAYIARPFRAAAARTDALIETWVRAVAATPGDAADKSIAPDADAPAVAPLPTTVNFCPQCGQRVTKDYRFCPGCGARLPREEQAA